MTNTTDDAKMRSQLFTGHLERLCSTTKVFEFILVQHCSKTAINENVEVSHKQVDGFVGSDVADLLPNNVQVTAMDLMTNEDNHHEWHQGTDPQHRGEVPCSMGCHKLGNTSCDGAQFCQCQCQWSTCS